MNMRMGGTQSRSGRFGAKRLPGIEPRFVDCPACNLVTMLDGFLYWRLIRFSTSFGTQAPSSGVERPRGDAVKDYVELYRRAPYTPSHRDIKAFLLLFK
jgi:hypothetical protein